MQVIDITPNIEVSAKKIRLAAYCRVSSKSQEQLLSYAAQIRYYSEYAKKNTEYELIDIYADKGLTATEMENRDELNRMLLDCKKGKIDRIIVKSMSRFMRNTEECLITLRMLKELGVSVFFEEQGIDTNKLNSEMIVTFPGMLAQKESENISGNVRWGIRKRMASGEYVCVHPAYGYMLKDKKLVINETEANLVRRIFDLYLKGYGTMSIAQMLNDEGVPKRNQYSKSQIWHRTGILYILTNEKYIGQAILQKTYVEDTFPYVRKLNKGEKDKYLVENYNPAIISKEDFYKVQELLKERKGEQSNSAKHFFSNIIRCPECGGVFRRQLTRGKAYWLCANYGSGRKKCKSRRVREKMIYECFVNLTYKLKYNRVELIETLIRKIESMLQTSSEDYIKIKNIDKEISDLCAKNVVVNRLHTSGVLKESDYSIQTAEINNKISQLRIEKKKQIIEEESDMLLDELNELNDTLIETKLDGNFNEELFEQIVNKIVIDDNSHITFNLIGGLKLTETIRGNGRCKEL